MDSLDLTGSGCSSVGTNPYEVRSFQAVKGGLLIPGSWPPFNMQLAAQVIKLTNQHRASIGLNTLKNNVYLRTSARWKACHMAEFLYMAHDDPPAGDPPIPPTSRSWYDRVLAGGWHGAAGENIAYGFATPDAVMNGWLSDIGHKQNIENTSWKAMGVGVATSKQQGLIFWCQDFGG